MSYQGLPGYGGGYNGQYGQQGAYRSQQSQNGGYMQQPIPQSPGAYPPGNLSQQQFMAMQVQNQQAFYENNRQQLPPMSQPVHYNQAPYATAQPQYCQSPPILPPQRSYQQAQYAHPRQQPQYTPARPVYHPQYDGSSDGPVNPFRQSQQQQPTPTPPRMAQPVSTTPIPPIVKQRTPSHPKTPLKPLDPHTLLPPLAEEYFGAAHSMALGTARQADPEALERYQKLIATGLGCLEAAMNEGRLEPRMEAKIRLRYASVLMEETVNMMEAETALSKGITLCEQNRFFDIKYNMQILLAKLLFRKSPKAAFISLDNNIEEVEAYRHHSWIYIFRFLRATLSLQTGRSADFHAAVGNFHAISDIAQRRSDYAVVTFASLMEALACLRTPGPDSVENLNRALAAAQTYQLSPECNISPLKVFAHMLGVTTSLMDDTSEKTFEKLKAFQLLLNEASKDKAWKTHSDTISIPLNRNKGDAQIISSDTRGLLNITEDGRDMLVFSFISKQDAYLIGYLLAGVARIHVKGDDVTPMKYLRDGLANTLDAKPPTKQREQIGPLFIFQDTLRKRRTTACYFYAFIAFRAIFTTEWAAAKDALTGLEETLDGIDHDSEPTLALLSIYLSAMYYQGTGNIDQALELYADESLALPDPAKPPQTPDAQVCRDLAVVAAMNTLLILNSRPNPDVESNTALLRRLDGFCPTHLNADIQTAYYIVRTVVTTNPPTSQLAIKAYMRQALTGAKKRGNFHLVCITLNVMCTRFFANIIGEQSIKSAMAAKEQSMKSGNKLWMSAATGLLARSQDIEGRGQEAAETMADAAKYAKVALQTPS